MQITTEVNDLELQIDNGEGELEDILVSVRISADMYFQREKVSGPPEDCYPADAGCDITKYELLTATDYNNKPLKPTPARGAAIHSELESCDFDEELWEAFDASQGPPEE